VSGRAQPPRVEIDCDWPGAPLQFIAWTTFPHDENRRAKCVSAQAHQQYALFMRELRAHPRLSEMDAVLRRELIERTGGWTYPELPAWKDEREDIRREGAKVLVVGHMLCLVRAVQVHHPELRPSLNLAAHIVERLRKAKGYGGPSNPKAVWAERKAIAPLCAAALLAWVEAAHEGQHPWVYLSDRDNMRRLLGHAKWFREWAGSTPGASGSRQGKVLISPTEAAEYVSDVEPREPRFSALSLEELDIARSYMAPINC
jgi:hypothetical protein